MTPRKFEVRGVDQNGDIWVVATDSRATAKSIAKTFRDEGYTDVHIVER